MSDCTPECLTDDPDIMSSQCVRSLQDKTIELRAERTELQESNKHWFARVKTAEARIDAALAIAGNDPDRVLAAVVKALKGEK